MTTRDSKRRTGTLVGGHMHRSRLRREWRHAVTRRARRAPSRLVPYTPRLRSADRKSLLLGTALASTLLLGRLLAPTPAQAVDCFAAATPSTSRSLRPDHRFPAGQRLHHLHEYRRP